MPIDIRLDSTTHDLSFIDDSFSLTDTFEEGLSQRLKIKLLTFLGEWVFNLDTGFPYYQSVFVKGTSKAQVDTLYRQHIIQTPDVQEILSFDSTLNAASRDYSLTFRVLGSSGETVEVTL